MREEIEKAIVSHVRWKWRLKNAIETGKSELRVADAGADNQCEFGKWLHGLSRLLDPSPAAKAHRENVRSLHAAFHREVAKILTQALDGKRDAALNAMKPGSPYGVTCVNLTSALTSWKQSLPE